MIWSRFRDRLVWLAMRLMAHGFFRIRIQGREHIPTRGPALLVSNHVTHFDGFLVGACVEPVVRFLVWKPYYLAILMHWALWVAKAIPIATRPREVAESMRLARAAFDRGEVMGIFAEGGISRTGDLQPFKRGIERLVRGLDVPIIPVHMSGLWGSVFSYSGGRFFWKRPRHLRHPVLISFGAPLPAHSTADQVREAVLRLGNEARVAQ
jgi:acyl-[acyl-carrier-protein]-phospholipid O-acyltransferase / long-chain-fatty-acid--[acyl-carrier-protein] ligase